MKQLDRLIELMEEFNETLSDLSALIEQEATRAENGQDETSAQLLAIENAIDRVAEVAA